MDKYRSTHNSPAGQATLDVEKLVPLLAGLFPHPGRAVTGIAELMLNAIEHGNLEIGHELKADWIARGIYHSELARR